MMFFPRRQSFGNRSCGGTSLTQESSGSSAPLSQFHYNRSPLHSSTRRKSGQRHAPFKDYISEASAFNRCAGGSEIVTTQNVCDHRGFKDISALQAIEHVRAVSKQHQLQLCGGNVLCMAGKSKECTQGAVCFHTYPQNPLVSSKMYNNATSSPAASVTVYFSLSTHWFKHFNQVSIFLRSCSLGIYISVTLALAFHLGLLTRAPHPSVRDRPVCGHLWGSSPISTSLWRII